MSIRVANKHHRGSFPGARVVNVMRPHPLANEWSHLKGTRATYHVATREDAVAAYRQWLREEVRRGGAVLEELRHLARIAQRQELVLLCCCAPLPCHADVIAKAVEWVLSLSASDPRGLGPVPSESPDRCQPERRGTPSGR